MDQQPSDPATRQRGDEEPAGAAAATASLRGLHSPFDALLGTEYVEAGPRRVVARLRVDERHHQPTGVVHGGVYASVIETVASIGAWLALDGEGAAMGITNHTEMLHAVSAGTTLTFTAEPVRTGRTLQLWEVAVTDEHGAPVAHGTVRLFNQRRAGGG